MESLNLLVQRVARAFYTPREAVVLDALVHKRGIMSDIQLAEYLKLPVKGVRETLSGLEKQHLVRHQLRSEKKAVQSNFQPVPRDYYFIDYKAFVDVVKFKIYHLQKKLRDMLKGDEAESISYQCMRCNRSFTALEVVPYFNNVNAFECPHDKTVLTEFDNRAKVEARRAQQSRLMDQLKPLIELLKRTDNLVIPSYSGAAPEAAVDAKEYKRTVASQGSLTKQIENMYSLPQASTVSVSIRTDDKAPVEEKREIKPLPHWGTTLNPPSTDHVDKKIKTEEVEEEDRADELEQIEVDNYYASLAQQTESSEVVQDVAPLTYVDEPVEFEDDTQEPIVTVNGEHMLISQVTPEMEAQMKIEEYEKYAIAHRSYYGTDGYD